MKTGSVTDSWVEGKKDLETPEHLRFVEYHQHNMADDVSFYHIF